MEVKIKKLVPEAVIPAYSKEGDCGLDLTATDLNVFVSQNYGYIEYSIGDRVAQLVIIPYPQIELKEVDELSSTERGETGFGSSGS